MIRGHDRPIERFLRAWSSGAMHHAWLLTGPRGAGKASFARAAALRLLAEAAGPPPTGDGLDVPETHPTARLIAAGSHPDYRLLERIENKTGTALARNISVDQVRALGDLFAVTPSMLGIIRSISTTSGFSRRAAASPAPPSGASPATSMSG